MALEQLISAATDTPGGLVVSLGTAVGAFALAMRRYLRTDKVDNATANAQVDIITKLSEQLDKANARADLAEKRADEAFRERNIFATKIGELQEQVRALTIQVEALRTERGVK